MIRVFIGDPTFTGAYHRAFRAFPVTGPSLVIDEIRLKLIQDDPELLAWILK
jgi:hypothetical protein